MLGCCAFLILLSLFLFSFSFLFFSQHKQSLHLSKYDIWMAYIKINTIYTDQYSGKLRSHTLIILKESDYTLKSNKNNKLGNTMKLSGSAIQYFYDARPKILIFFFFFSLFTFFFLLHIYFSLNMSRTPATVPCKYKTGRVLGNGTYATVKGK